MKDLDTEEKMVSYLKDEKRWSYSEPPTVSDAFGKFKEFDGHGRDTQLSKIWKAILTCNTDSPTKPVVLYFHGSPGPGQNLLTPEDLS